MTARTTLRWARGALLDLLFPPRCAGCGRRGEWLCAACFALVPPLTAPRCERCGTPRAGTRRCRFCDGGTVHHLDWARSAYPFTGPLRAAIHRFKYEKERARAAHLGPLLLPLLYELPADDLHGPPLLVPVPLSATRRRERGYNQAEALAKVLAERRGWSTATRLVRTRATPPQVGLDPAARRENVRGAFAWQGESLAGQRVLLIDDVLTTGATANECAAVLKSAGAGWVGLLTVARALGESARG